jgi:hypothetical protein
VCTWLWQARRTRRAPPQPAYRIGAYSVDDEDEDEDGGEEFEVEAIVARRQNRAAQGHKWHFEYLVRWQGYSADADTWEPRHNLQSASQLLDACDYREGLVGRRVRKTFHGYGTHEGVVAKHTQEEEFSVWFDDGELQQHIKLLEVQKILLPSKRRLAQQ